MAQGSVIGKGGLLETKSYRILLERLREAAEEGVNAIVYGPPSTEKSYVLETLCAEFSAHGRPAVYAYCGPRCTEKHMWLTVAEAAGIPIRSSLRWAARHAVISAMREMPKLPAIVLDEAQHLDVDALEGVRQLHDLTRRGGRKGCGIILAGSHRLLQEFLMPARRPRLEQMLSRFGIRVQLEGMSKEEILTLAAKAFGNGKPAALSEKQQKLLLDRCSVEDIYHLGQDGKPAPRTYYSSRRLVEYAQQTRKKFAMREVA